MITLDKAKVLLLDLPLVEPFAAAHGTTSLRTVTVVRVEGDGPDGRVVGWGECSALPAATYSAETAYGSYTTLEERLVPGVLGKPFDLTNLLAPPEEEATRAPMAAAAVEMALVDACLTAEGRSLASWLGVTAETVSAGAAVGLGSLEDVVAKAVGLAEQGYGRLKVKIQPGHDIDVVKALKAESTLADVDIDLDANCSFEAEDIDLLASLAETGIVSLEQPLALGLVDASAELVRRLEGSGVAVVGDESVPSVAELERLASAGALTGVAIKPPRLGGMLAAQQMLTRCQELGLAATAGGMLETGLGRHALVALAALPGFTLTGDLSPAGRWLHADPWPDVTMTGREMVVPTGPGVVPEPDPDVLAAHTVDRRVLRAK